MIEVGNGIAVDLDDTLQECMPHLCEWYNRKFGTRHELRHYPGDWFTNLWGVDEEEGSALCAQFHREASGAERWVPGLADMLAEIAVHYRLHIVTYRIDAVKDETARDVEEHLPGVFQSIVHCLTLQAGRVVTRPKAEVCRELGLGLIIEDSLSTALNCAQSGIPVLLMDIPQWNDDPAVELPENIRRIMGGWPEVRDYLLST